MALSKHRCARFGLAVALLAFGGADSAYWERCAPAPREIFSGVTYGCEGLERTGHPFGCVSNSQLRGLSFT